MRDDGGSTLPRLPPGRVLTEKWPVLTYGEVPRVTVTSDIHCVTRWSRLDSRWEGVAVREILRLANVRPEANAVMAHSEGGYTANILLTDLIAEDVLVAFKHDGRDLPPERGGPCREAIELAL